MATLELTTLANVKASPLVSLSGSTADAYLTDLVTATSRTIAQWLGWGDMTNATHTEEYDIPPRWDRLLWTRKAPITSVTSIKSRNSIATAFSGVTALASTSYAIDTSSELKPRIVIESGNVYPGPLSLQLIYVAGFAANQAALESAFPDIEMAARMQVVYEYNRRNELGAQAMSIAGASESYTSAVQLEKGVRQRLSAYRRPIL